MFHDNYLKKKDPATLAETLKQLKVLKDNEFIDNKLYYLKSTSMRLDFMVNQKCTIEEILYFP